MSERIGYGPGFIMGLFIGMVIFMGVIKVATMW